MTKTTSNQPVCIDAAQARRPTMVAAIASAALLRQCAELLSSLEKEVFSTVSTAIAGSTIGQHVRHCVDHFAAIAKADLASGEPIYYDRRQRGVDIEADRDLAVRTLEEVADSLMELARHTATETVQISVMLTADGGETVIDSTLAREIAFAAHHAMHHYAMIGAIVRECGADVPASFGRAPSTVSYERTK